MKMMNYSIMRCVSAIAIGILLMVWPETAIVYLVIAIGAMFFLPSLFTLVGYFVKGRQLGMYFPIISLGSLLFGLWLMVSPAFFVGILMYVLGVVLVFAGISQIAGLLGARSHASVSFGYYVMPILILFAGLVVLVNPFAAATIPFIILGISSTAYGISELINIYKFRRKEEKLMKHEIVIEDVTPIEEIPNEIKE
ncbi:MAG: DUF308 domain-containing protein [Bacteroides sp.]|nr:DUF308 domain-containing protein [Bacteroidaceae bacterium]MBQ8265676.1 DUF308 domain-containing protein [Bacteroides sp.]MBQ8875765.1 DUF308 domain-containing protein [Bacteroides sp.]